MVYGSLFFGVTAIEVMVITMARLLCYWWLCDSNTLTMESNNDNNNVNDKEQVIRDLSQGAGLLAKGTAALTGEAVVAAGKGISFLSTWFKTTIERGQQAQQEQLMSRQRIAELEALVKEQQKGGKK